MYCYWKWRITYKQKLLPNKLSNQSLVVFLNLLFPCSMYLLQVSIIRNKKRKRKLCARVKKKKKKKYNKKYKKKKEKRRKERYFGFTIRSTNFFIFSRRYCLILIFSGSLVKLNTLIWSSFYLKKIDVITSFFIFSHF